MILFCLSACVLDSCVCCFLPFLLRVPAILFIERLMVMAVSRIFSFVLCVVSFSVVFFCCGKAYVFAQPEAEIKSVMIGSGKDPHDAKSKSDDEKKTIDNEAFFDAEDIVPNGEMTRRGPNEVNPNVQPASKFVIVRKNYKRDTKESRLVAAERAMKLGRNDSALDLFDALYQKNKKDARVLMGRAVVLQKLGRFDEAMGMYEELSKVEPDNVDVKVNMLGLLSTRFPSIALRKLLDLREKNMSNVGLVSQIAVCYAALGDTREALKYMGTAASMEPDNAMHLYNMAVINDRAGNKKQAIVYYEKALEVDTVNGGGNTIPREDVYERLAQIR